MKRIIYLAGVIAITALTGCVHHHHGRGGTYQYYERDTGYGRGHPPRYHRSHYDRGSDGVYIEGHFETR